MREWQLKAGDPLALTLACDIRLTPSNYCDDQIWELALGGGDPPALALQTTYGLRARLMRIFPRFILGEMAVSDPVEFAQPPVVSLALPNFIALSFVPFPGIDVSIEYWVPQSQAVAGRVQVTNNGSAESKLVMEWATQLVAAPKNNARLGDARLSSTPGTAGLGQRMAAVEMQAATILAGSSGGLEPVIFMTGGPRLGSGAYPSLALRMDLAPGSARQVTWVHAALDSREASFNLARSVAALRWEAERARLELFNARQVEIYTGDPDWDAALMLAQKQAISLLVGPTEQMPNPCLVLARQPDLGYSLRGDGSDYNHLWNGQTPLESYYLAGLILPAAPELAQGLVRNFLLSQAESGFIDWKPGPAGQRSQILAAPLLASLAWRIYEATERSEWLQEVYEPLLRFVQAWFAPEHDRDGDGVPEWDHPMQAGDEDHPIYSRWQPWSLGVEITSAESPALTALLHRECLTLARMARVLGREQDLPGLETAAERLKSAVESAWNETASAYFDRDRDTHFSTHGEELASGRGSGTILVQRSFEHPVRLQILIQTDETLRRRPVIFIHGRSASGHPRIERINDEQLRWRPGLGQATGKYVYSMLERIEIHGLEPDDQIHFDSVGYDFQDHSTLAPLWAGIPRPARAKQLVEETLTNPERFWRACGVPACVRPPQAEGAEVCASVHLPWNQLIGEGLLQYGFRQEAAELVTRLMSVAVQSLKTERAFRRYYHAETGQGLGERNALNGLAPLSLFLETLGIRLISPTRVALSGFTPYPRPVTVKYRGLTILCQKEKTTVIFPDGQAIVIDDPTPRIVSLE